MDYHDDGNQQISLQQEFKETKQSPKKHYMARLEHIELQGGVHKRL